MLQSQGLMFPFCDTSIKVRRVISNSSLEKDNPALYSAITHPLKPEGFELSHSYFLYYQTRMIVPLFLLQARARQGLECENHCCGFKLPFLLQSVVSSPNNRD